MTTTEDWLCVCAGSLVVSMVVQGSTSGVNSTMFAICDDISNGTSFTFSGTTVSMSTYMTVNGQTFYGVSCAASVSVAVVV